MLYICWVVYLYLYLLSPCDLSGTYTLPGEVNLSEEFSSLLKKTLILCKEFFFLLECTPFQRGLGVQDSKHEVKKAVSIIINRGKLISVTGHINLIYYSVTYERKIYNIHNTTLKQTYI